jgi:hypothetical protein
MTGSQIRNDQMEALLGGTFTTRDEFMGDGARLLSAVQATHREGGGMLVEGWMADSIFSFGHAAQAGHWTSAGVAQGDYFATADGGPYADLDGATEYLWIADAPWQEAVTLPIFTWRWVWLNSLASSQCIVAKWLTSTANRSWKLWYNSAAGAFEFVTNTTGAAAQDVPVTSTYAEAIDTWYFVGAYWLASTIQSIYVGAADDAVLTPTDLVAGVSASVFNGTAPLTQGANGNPANYLNGKLGVGHTRFNVPQANVDGYAARLFQLTNIFYQS